MDFYFFVEMKNRVVFKELILNSMPTIYSEISNSVYLYIIEKLETFMQPNPRVILISLDRGVMWNQFGIFKSF